MTSAGSGPAQPRASSGLQSAVLEVRVLPWRPRARVLNPSRLRELAAEADPTVGADDIAGLVIGLGVWLLVLIAAPLLVLLLAAGLFSVELPLLLAVGLLLAGARFAGLVPWTVLVLDPVTGDETRESYRNGLRAMRRIRGVNHDRRIVVRWAWT